MTTAIIDTHTHLCDAVFDEDRDQVLQRARVAGVGSIVLVGEDLQDARANLELAKLYAMLLETDSPVLGPDPKARNEPANINLVVEAIAQIKNVSPEDVIGVVVENTK